MEIMRERIQELERENVALRWRERTAEARIEAEIAKAATTAAELAAGESTPSSSDASSPWRTRWTSSASAARPPNATPISRAASARRRRAYGGTTRRRRRVRGDARARALGADAPTSRGSRRRRDCPTRAVVEGTGARVGGTQERAGGVAEAAGAREGGRGGGGDEERRRRHRRRRDAIRGIHRRRRFDARTPRRRRRARRGDARVHRRVRRARDAATRKVDGGEEIALARELSSTCRRWRHAGNEPRPGDVRSRPRVRPRRVAVPRGVFRGLRVGGGFRVDGALGSTGLSPREPVPGPGAAWTCTSSPRAVEIARVAADPLDLASRSGLDPNVVVPRTYVRTRRPPARSLIVDALADSRQGVAPLRSGIPASDLPPRVPARVTCSSDGPARPSRSTRGDLGWCLAGSDRHDVQGGERSVVRVLRDAVAAAHRGGAGMSVEGANVSVEGAADGPLGVERRDRVARLGGVRVRFLRLGASFGEPQRARAPATHGTRSRALVEERSWRGLRRTVGRLERVGDTLAGGGRDGGPVAKVSKSLRAAAARLRERRFRSLTEIELARLG